MEQQTAEEGEKQEEWIDKLAVVFRNPSSWNQMFKARNTWRLSARPVEDLFSTCECVCVAVYVSRGGRSAVGAPAAGCSPAP